MDLIWTVIGKKSSFEWWEFYVLKREYLELLKTGSLDNAIQIQSFIGHHGLHSLFYLAPLSPLKTRDNSHHEVVLKNSDYSWPCFRGIPVAQLEKCNGRRVRKGSQEGWEISSLSSKANKTLIVKNVFVIFTTHRYRHNKQFVC